MTDRAAEIKEVGRWCEPQDVIVMDASMFLDLLDHIADLLGNKPTKVLPNSERVFRLSFVPDRYNRRAAAIFWRLAHCKPNTLSAVALLSEVRTLAAELQHRYDNNPEAPMGPKGSSPV